MQHRVVRIGSSALFGITAGVLMLSLVFAATLAFSRPKPIQAATGCPQSSTAPQFNIVFCGLQGNNAQEDIASFQNLYNSNTDGRVNDLQAVYNWGGASPALVASMNTSNTMLGAVFSNGTLMVNGQTVGTNALISARWLGTGPGFAHIEGNVWSRPATTFLSNLPQEEILVHFNDNGQADFAVETKCGNGVKFTPMAPPPKPVASLTCDQLLAVPQGDVKTTLTYSFTANASAQNTTIQSYTFTFDDTGTPTVVPTSAMTASTTHTFAQAGTHHASVAVNGNVTSQNCMTTITIQQPQQPSSLACVSLTPTQLGKPEDFKFSFAVVASAVNATITGYTFNFGDQTTQTVPTTDTKASVDHQYNKPGTYNVTAMVNGSATANTCNAQVTIATPQVLAAAVTTPQQPLVNTGPGQVVGLFGIMSAAGGLFHHFVLRRRQTS